MTMPSKRARPGGFCGLGKIAVTAVAHDWVSWHHGTRENRVGWADGRGPTARWMRRWWQGFFAEAGVRRVVSQKMGRLFGISCLTPRIDSGPP